jgi:glycosyltransferase involved in cell wall biosynthesis
MTVTVVIPLYNKEQFLAQALESVLEQTYPHVEIIVVDDGSTDTSAQVAEGYSVRVIHQKNQGLSAARNTGIKAAKGQLILPLDADDWIDRMYLTKTVALMRGGVGIVSTDMQRFGEQKDLIKAERRTLLQQLGSNQLPVTSLVRKAAIECAGYYWPHGWEDWNLWIDILRLGWTVDVVNEPLFHYRVIAGGLNTDHTRQRQELLQHMRERHPDFRGV